MKLTAEPATSPMPAVEHVQLEAARQAGDHALAVDERGLHLLHVLADHDVRQASGGRELAHVLVGRLRSALTERQRSRREKLGRAGRERDQLAHRERRERRAHRLLELLLQVAAHEPGVRLAHLHERLARLEVDDRREIDRAIGSPAAQHRQVQHQ
jgi:hypothetical protein